MSPSNDFSISGFQISAYTNPFQRGLCWQLMGTEAEAHSQTLIRWRVSPNGNTHQVPPTWSSGKPTDRKEEL